MTSKPPKPTAQIEAYVNAIGYDKAADFLLLFGGAELYLTTNPKGRSQLVQALGRDHAVALAKASENLPARVPTAKPWLASFFKFKGLSNADIARKLHVTDVTVRSYLKQARARERGEDIPRQLPLF